MSFGLMSSNTVNFGIDRVLFILVDIASVCNESSLSPILRLCLLASLRFVLPFFSLKPICSQHFPPFAFPFICNLLPDTCYLPFAPLLLSALCEASLWDAFCFCFFSALSTSLYFVLLTKKPIAHSF